MVVPQASQLGRWRWRPIHNTGAAANQRAVGLALVVLSLRQHLLHSSRVADLHLGHNLPDDAIPRVADRGHIVEHWTTALVERLVYALYLRRHHLVPPIPLLLGCMRLQCLLCLGSLGPTSCICLENVTSHTNKDGEHDGERVHRHSSNRYGIFL